VCSNIKHLAMLKTMFYAGLRASELCNLDDSDVDLKALTVFVRGWQGWRGRSGLHHR
jgi:integrase/recombinase XerD